MIRRYSVRVAWSDRDEAYVATSPEFPGLTGVNADAQAALVELRDAMEMAVEVLEEDGEPVPKPLVLQEYSGKFVLRVPREMHAELARRALDSGMSLNALALTLIARGLGDAEARAEAESSLRTLVSELRAQNFAVSRSGSATNAPMLNALEQEPALYAAPGAANKPVPLRGD